MDRKFYPTWWDDRRVWLCISGTWLGLVLNWWTLLSNLFGTKFMRINLLVKHSPPYLIWHQNGYISPSRQMLTFAFGDLQLKELDPNTLSEQEEDLLYPVKHQPTLGSQPSLLQMGPCLSVLVLTSQQSLGKIWPPENLRMKYKNLYKGSYKIPFLLIKVREIKGGTHKIKQNNYMNWISVWNYLFSVSPLSSCPYFCFVLGSYPPCLMSAETNKK